MTGSLLNIIIFILTTLFYYYFLAQKLTPQDIVDPHKMEDFERNKLKKLGFYILSVVVSQFFINIYVIVDKCGGNFKPNIGTAAMVTIFPWLFLFGFVIAILSMYPGFKLAFSDVLGYFYISSSANKLLTDLLVDESVQEKIDDTKMTQDEKHKIVKVADTIIKICGNTSILINRMVPSNFEEFWKTLTPLKKDKYKPTQEGNVLVENSLTLHLKANLLELVISKDNVGEASWFLYTGIVIISIISMKISTNKCYVSAASMEKNYKNFQQKEDTALATKANNPKPVYTVS